MRSFFKRLFCRHDYEFVVEEHVCAYIDGGTYGFDGGGMFNRFRLAFRCKKCEKVKYQIREEKID